MQYFTQHFLCSHLQLYWYQLAPALLHGWWGWRAALHLLPASRQRHHVVLGRPGSPWGRQGLLSGQRGRLVPPITGPEPRASGQWQRQCSRALCQLEPVLHQVSYWAQQPPQRSHQLRQHCLCLDCYLPGGSFGKLVLIGLNRYVSLSKLTDAVGILQFIRQHFHSNGNEKEVFTSSCPDATKVHIKTALPIIILLLWIQIRWILITQNMAAVQETYERWQHFRFSVSFTASPYIVSLLFHILLFAWWYMLNDWIKVF